MLSVSNPMEKALLNAVTVPNLRLCLDNMRPAIEGLWRPGAPRIVQDFTDHGIEHYERISVYAHNLLSSNPASTLSAIETFLLVGGIYLHDVGMQCDVTTEDGQEIKKRAIRLGAKFNGLAFTAKSASRYSLDEQKAIRKNHHYLSAAWIEYAHATGNTVLGTAAKQIPFELVKDLMDICLHHTTIPIERCGINVEGGGVGRKQLVAALLRFADELDIDSNRVEMTAVTSFRVDGENAVFWWLHNLTGVIFNPPNTFRIVVRLCDSDFHKFSLIIQSAYLERFRSKNKPVLDILRQNGFPIYLDADSGVIQLHLAPALPEPICQVISKMIGSTPQKEQPSQHSDSEHIAEHSQDLREGIETITRLLSIPEVKLAVETYKHKFLSTQSQLENLQEYKDAHDCIHELRDVCYHPIRIEIDRLKNPNLVKDARRNLSRYYPEFERVTSRLVDVGHSTLRSDLVLVQSAREELTLFLTASSEVPEIQAERLENKFDDIRDVIQSQLPHVNTMLVTAARALRLNDLKEALRKVRQAIPPKDGIGVSHSEDRRELHEAIDAVMSLQRIICAKIAEHDNWQEIDTHCRLMEQDVVRGNAKWIRQWPRIRSLAAELCKAHDSEWTRLIRNEFEGLTEIISALPSDTEELSDVSDAVLESAIQKFLAFYSRAAKRFYTVDKELLQVCVELGTVSQRLTNLIEKS